MTCASPSTRAASPPEVTLGFNPGYGIALSIDIAAAPRLDLLLSGRTVHASEALRMGLVNPWWRHRR